MKNFFLRADGNDRASGRSHRDAWASLPRLNRALRLGVVQRGDTVRLRRGDKFFGRIDGVPVLTNSAEEQILTFTAYGSGSRPVISGYRVAVRAAWRKYGEGTWRVPMQQSHRNWSGDTAGTSVNVGHLRVDGTVWASRRLAIPPMEKAWDFFCTPRWLYVRSVQNPSGHRVEVAFEGPLFVVQSNTTVSGLHFEGTGSHGIDGQASGVRVVDNEVSYCGGSYLEGFGSGNVRYGNGIQAWIGSRDWTVKRNVVREVFEAAITFQGSQSEGATDFRSLHASGNLIWNCGWAFEFFANGADRGRRGAGFYDCSFTGNLAINSGYSWGQAVRLDPEGRGTHLLIYENDFPVRMKITQNIFVSAYSNYLFALNGIPEGVHIDENQIVLAPRTKLCWQDPQTIEQAHVWAARKGIDQHSRFCLLADDVLGPREAAEVLRSVTSGPPTDRPVTRQSTAAASSAINLLSAALAGAARPRLASAAINSFHGRLPAAKDSAVVVAFAGSSFAAGSTPQPLGYVRAFADAARRQLSEGRTSLAVECVDFDDTARLARQWRGLLVVDASRPVVTSSTYLTRGAISTMADLNPDMVFHMIAASDYEHGIAPRQMSRNLGQKIRLMNARTASETIHVLVRSFAQPTHAGGFLWAQYAAELSGLAQKDPHHIVFLDLAEAFQQVGVPGPDPFGVTTADAAHLNMTGQTYLGKRLWDAFEL